MNLSDIIERNAAFTPEKAAIRLGGGVLTYRDLAARIRRAAHGLRELLGVAPGDRVAVLALNHPDTLVLLYACARIGAIMVPLNWRLAVPEQLYILEHSGAKALVLQPAFAAVLGPLAERMPQCRPVWLGGAGEGAAAFEALCADDGDAREEAAGAASPVLICHTSGTTGRPKGAVLAQRALVWNGVMSHHMHDMVAADHVLTVLPLFHVGGLNIQTSPALHCGATVTLHERFDAGATLAAIAAARPTLTVQVPATMAAMIEHPSFAETDLGSLRALSTGSTIVPIPLIEAFEARGVPVLQVYGSTETSPIAVYTRLAGESSLARPGTTGLPGLAAEARIVGEDGSDRPPGADGEILVRGPAVLTGYWNDPEATREALAGRWFHTGDIGRRDADGYFFVRDRKKNMIVSGGENIYPSEIERVLMTHPRVSACAVVPRPDPRWQEVPVAFVVTRDGAPIGTDEVAAFLSLELARFKLPREVRCVPDLPRNAMGKVQHFRLREMAAAPRHDAAD